MSTLSAIHGLTSTVFSNLFVTLPVPKSEPGLSDRTYIVTGANQGLGFESSNHLLRIGVGKLIMGVRNLDKGEAARKELLAATNRKPETVEVWHVDMDSYASVQAFARQARALPRLDGVLANAGIMTDKFALAEDNERTLTVNIVSTFLLFLLVLPKLRESPATGYFVVPNSALHYVASTKEIISCSSSSSSSNHKKPMFARMNNPDEADMKDRYNLSKLLVVYATRELDARLKLSGKKAVVVNTPNPSYCKSQLVRDVATREPPDFMARTAEMGSRALVHGLFAGRASSGQYLTNCHVQGPASFVTNKTGLQIQAAFYDELIQKLEKISPGISLNI